MAAFKGGPALPKRAETMSSTSTPASSSTTPTKRKYRTTHLLSNRPETGSSSMHQDDLLSGISSSSSPAEDSSRDIKPKVIDGGETLAPTSEMRSTVTKGEAVDMMMNEDMYDEEEHETPRKVGKMDAEMKDVKPVIPATPKKAGRKKSVASPSTSKEVMKTPTKKVAGSGASTPRAPEQAPLASAWQAEQWNDLNFAILKVVHDHASELYDASPSLTPWKVKGRLLVKLRQLMKEASGGDVASKRWDTELKPTRNKGGSPKKQSQ